MNPRIYDGIKWTGNPEIDSRLATGRWLEAARPNQILNIHRPEFAYLCLMGRGYGKTELGVSNIRDICFQYPGIEAKAYSMTSDEVTNTLMEGPSGFLNCIPESCYEYKKQAKTIKLWNGSRIMGHSVEEPETLRGKQSHIALFDEFSAWKRQQMAFDMIMFGLRLKAPFKTKLIITTTPKPQPKIFELIADPKYVKVFGSTWENRENLDDNFIDQLSRYKGTALERQELFGEVLTGEKDLVFKGEWFKLYPAHRRLPSFSYVFQSWDTAFTTKKTNDPCAATTWGVFHSQEFGPGIMLIDAWDDHLDYPMLRSRMAYEFSKGHGPDQNIFLQSFLVEMKGSGMPLYQDVGQMGIPVQGYNPGTNDKVSRATLVTYLAEQGKVWVPEDKYNPGKVADFAKPWFEELTRFSKDPAVIKYQSDNYVDSTTQAWNHIIQMGIARSMVEYDGESRYHNPRPQPINFQNRYVR